MRNGFTFNGVHTSAFSGVTVRTVDRPILPPVKEAVHAAAEMDGEYDFTAASGREYYGTRTMQIEFGITAENLRALQKKLTALSRFFKGRSELIFDDIPTVKWDARVIDSVAYTPEHGGHKAVLAVTFKAMPFSRLLWGVFDGPCLDDEITLDSNYPLDSAEYYTLAGAGANHIVPNVGDVPAKPVVTAKNVSDAFLIRINGKSLKVDLSGTFTIDFDSETVYTGTGGGKVSIMQYVTGSFGCLEPNAENGVFFMGADRIEMDYTPQFMYDALFDDSVDWGDSDD